MLGKDIFSHSRFAGFADIPTTELDDYFAVRALRQLGEEYTVHFDGEHYSITLGGTKAKKITTVRGQRFGMVTAKAIIIYVRKYL